jgi:hypothetical protein
MEYVGRSEKMTVTFKVGNANWKQAGASEEQHNFPLLVIGQQHFQHAGMKPAFQKGKSMFEKYFAKVQKALVALAVDPAEFSKAEAWEAYDNDVPAKEAAEAFAAAYWGEAEYAEAEYEVAA